MKKQTLFYSGCVAAMVMLSVIMFNACTFNVSTANISGADLVKVLPDGKSEKVGTVYHPNDGAFHLYVTVSNAPEDTKVKASWFAVGTNAGKDELIDENEVTLGNQSQIDFSLSLPRPWPTGKYKVNLFLNNKADKSIDFEVR